MEMLTPSTHRYVLLKIGLWADPIIESTGTTYINDYMYAYNRPQMVDGRQPTYTSVLQ